MFYKFGVFVSELLKIDITSHLGASVVFFVQDLTKITILLLLMMSVMTFVRGHLPMKKIRSFIIKMPFGLAHFFAALLGAVTPFLFLFIPFSFLYVFEKWTPNRSHLLIPNHIATGQ